MNTTKSKRALATPFNPPKWQGGINYYSTIFQCLQELDMENQLNIDWNGRYYSQLTNKHVNKVDSIRNLLRLFDVVRSLHHVSFPAPISRFANKSFHWIPDLQQIELPEMFTQKEVEKPMPSFADRTVRVRPVSQTLVPASSTRTTQCELTLHPTQTAAQPSPSFAT